MSEMDPSMLIGFLIRDEDDWRSWREDLSHIAEKAIIHVADKETPPNDIAPGRQGAIDEVEMFDTEEEL